MCVICALANNAKISEREWDNCWDSNPHGFGFMYVNENEEIVIKKEMDEKPAKKMFFEDFEKYLGKTPFVLHFRIASHGSKCLDNTHPFEVKTGKDGKLKMAFCHNGVIQKTTPKAGDDRSDTRIFRDDFLQNLPTSFLINDPTCWLIEEFIGYSKLAFLTTDKKVTILNAHHGEYDWELGRWFSNGSYKNSRVRSNVTYNGSASTPMWQKPGTPQCNPASTGAYKGIQTTKMPKDDEHEIPDGVPSNANKFGVTACDYCKELVPLDDYHWEWSCCFSCIEKAIGITALLDYKVAWESCSPEDKCKGITTPRGLHCKHAKQVVAVTEEEMYAYAGMFGLY